MNKLLDREERILLILDSMLTVMKRELKLKPLGISSGIIEACRNDIAKLLKEVITK